MKTKIIFIKTQKFPIQRKQFCSIYLHKLHVLLHWSTITVEYGGILQYDASLAQSARLSEQADAAAVVAKYFNFIKLIEIAMQERKFEN